MKAFTGMNRIHSVSAKKLFDTDFRASWHLVKMPSEPSNMHLPSARVAGAAPPASILRKPPSETNPNY